MTLTKNLLKITLGLVVAGTTLTSCSKDEPLKPVVIVPANARPNVVYFGLTNNNHINTYNAQTAETSSNSLTVTGLQPDEKLLSIDFRPSTGQLYALGNSSRLYIINLNTGAATAVGTAQFSPNINGAIASIDFNPTVDRVRLVTNAGQNLRLNPETGTVAAIDGNISVASAGITNVAYTNSIAGAATTELFDIDPITKKLYRQDPPNNGTLVDIGTINVNFSGKAGFDINADNSVILATLIVNGQNKIYTINTTTAAAAYLADVSNDLIDIAIQTNAVAYAINSTDGNLQIFNPTTATAPVSKTVTGLAAGESILGIDFRPINGQLYALAATTTGAAKLYTINLASGAATGVGAGFAITAGTTAAGVDFNPTVDRIRVVTSAGQNLRLNPNDGTIASSDAVLNGGGTTANSAAYTNNFAGTTTTQLFVTDATKLYLQNPPNNGTLTAIGNLGVTVDELNGFDIGGRSNSAFAIFTVGTATNVYSINTTTGAATAGAAFPNKVRGMAIGLGF